MRLLSILLFVVLLNCEDKQSKQKTATKPVAKDSIAEKPDTATIEKPKPKTPEFPVLTDKNAMEFFDTYADKNKENRVRITTDFGVIEVELYRQTKYHRANFIYLTKRGYFDGTQFYRVVPNFVAQAGNSDDPKISRRRGKIGRYLLPKDTRHGFKHHRGVLSMPSSEIENPHKMASPYEFFIVVQKGGAHHLNDNYTVFGKVTKGLDVAIKISEQEADGGDWPRHNIYIDSVEIVD